MRNSGKDAAGEVKAEVAKVPKFVVDVVPEDVEEQQIPDDVQRAAVKKLIREELIQMRVTRIQQQRLDQRSRMNHLLRDKRDQVREDERIVHVRRAAERRVGADGDEHGSET